MKVLLKKSKIHIGRIVADTLLVWFLANLFGSICFWLFTDFEGAFVFSFIFSSPVLLLAIPNFYVLYAIRKKKNRIVYALSSVFVLCLLLFALLYVCFHDIFKATQLAAWMSPYAVGAMVSIFMVTSEFILAKDEQQLESTPHDL